MSTPSYTQNTSFSFSFSILYLLLHATMEGHTSCYVDRNVIMSWTLTQRHMAPWHQYDELLYFIQAAFIIMMALFITSEHNIYDTFIYGAIYNAFMLLYGTQGCLWWLPTLYIMAPRPLLWWLYAILWHYGFSIMTLCYFMIFRFLYEDFMLLYDIQGSIWRLYATLCSPDIFIWWLYTTLWYLDIFKWWLYATLWYPGF